MRLFFALLLASSSFALAAEPGDRLYAAERLDSTRFADSDEDGPAFSPGVALTVLVVDGERLRVLSDGGKIGWVPADKVRQLADLPDDVRDVVIQELLGSQGFGGSSLQLGR